MVSPVPQIKIERPSQEFAMCWAAAANHVLEHSGRQISWLKKELASPFFEHFSFSLDNQFYFVRVIDADGVVAAPGMEEAVTFIANGWDGIPCIMPMRCLSGTWHPVGEGYGLQHVATGEPIIPDEHKPDGPIHMTAWELQDFGLKMVINHIENDLGYEVLMSQSHPDLSPSIWFKGEHGNEWVVVHTFVYPDQTPVFQFDLKAVEEECAKSLWGIVGNLAEVHFCNVKQDFGPNSEILPMIRGGGAGLKFDGLQKL